MAQRQQKREKPHHQLSRDVNICVFTWALPLKERLSVKSHFTLALSLPSVIILPKSISYTKAIHTNSEVFNSNSSLNFYFIILKPLQPEVTYLGVYKVGTKFIVSSRDFNGFRRLWRNLHWSHEHADRLWTTNNYYQNPQRKKKEKKKGTENWKHKKQMPKYIVVT